MPASSGGRCRRCSLSGRSRFGPGARRRCGLRPGSWGRSDDGHLASCRDRLKHDVGLGRRGARHHDDPVHHGRRWHGIGRGHGRPGPDERHEAEHRRRTQPGHQHPAGKRRPPARPRCARSRRRRGVTLSVGGRGRRRASGGQSRQTCLPVSRHRRGPRPCVRPRRDRRRLRIRCLRRLRTRCLRPRTRRR